MKDKEYIKLQFQCHALRAQWWMNSAITKTCCKRKMYHGTISSNGPEFTEQEKIDDAMDASHRHIEICQELMEAFIKEEEKIKDTEASWYEKDSM